MGREDPDAACYWCKSYAMLVIMIRTNVLLTTDKIARTMRSHRRRKKGAHGPLERSETLSAELRSTCHYTTT